MLSGNMVNVKDYGAIGDGLMLDTRAIQNAVNSGKIVYFPAGVYRTGTIYLRSGGGLYLAENAVILGSKYPEDYNSADFDPRNTSSVSERASGAHLIIARDCENVSISGQGSISGNRNGIFNTDLVHTPNGNRPRYVLPRWRPSAMVYFVGCRNVKISDVKLIDPCYWSCFLHDCEDVEISNISIAADRMTNNSDGLDIDCCRRVKISGCYIYSGDDAIAIRGNQSPLKKDAPCSDIVVTDCVLSAAACGVRLGVGNGSIRNCRLSNLTIVNTNIGIGFCPSYSPEKSTEISDVIIENSSINAYQGILMMPLWRGDVDISYAKPMRNILFRNLKVVSQRANVLAAPVKAGLYSNISIENSSFELRSGAVAPRKNHWDQTEFGIVNLRNLSPEILVNCRGISPDKRKFILCESAPEKK